MQRNEISLPEYHFNNGVTLYWRSDTRSPEEIFRMGFKPRAPFVKKNKNDENFWNRSIHMEHDSAMCDAIKENCVCMTTRFESAGLFPVDRPDNIEEKRTTYFYAIALQNPLKINLMGELCEGENNIPVNTNEAVIDLHSYQVMYANFQFSKYNEMLSHSDCDSTRKKYLAFNINRFLFGYEAIASRVRPSNIIGAIEVEQSPMQKCDVRNLPLRQFHVTSNFFLNDAFNIEQTMDVRNDHNIRQIHLDYSECKEETIQQFFYAAEKSKFETPLIRHGVGGKTLGLFEHKKKSDEVRSDLIQSSNQEKSRNTL